MYVCKLVCMCLWNKKKLCMYVCIDTAFFLISLLADIFLLLRAKIKKETIAVKHPHSRP